MSKYEEALNKVLETLWTHNSTFNKINKTITLILFGMVIQTISIVILALKL